MKEKDICQTCKHYWVDFPMPLYCYVSHCEIIDEKYKSECSMDDYVPYPCVKCPFHSYKRKN